jgi:hypothetical protein
MYCSHKNSNDFIITGKEQNGADLAMVDLARGHFCYSDYCLIYLLIALKHWPNLIS